jgi:acyl CoA:acetate/3-ketoacid CoA transferase alpha subunit
MKKTVTLAQALAAVSSGSSIAFGGGGIQRKPMAVARALATADLDDLTVVTMLGGPETDLLIGAGKVRELRFALDWHPIFVRLARLAVFRSLNTRRRRLSPHSRPLQRIYHSSQHASGLIPTF